ncbi:MAG: 5-methyltetrahydropteroyltriglutamate--homocysteine S-methyltransferase [Spirochaetes bacterium]|nr:MAG: 5-methyltetrahydropteroyltriglutamate--homocysteine S-methyltransferase [Spirochaetota bacterium]
MAISITAFGYPRIGDRREFKTGTESFWESRIDEKSLMEALERINTRRYEKLAAAGLDLLPSNDFSLYDSMLDHATMFGIVPERFADVKDGLARYYAMGRGNERVQACEMTKWFDSNYHYIVPELTGEFRLVKNRPLESWRWVKEKTGRDSKPVIIGPFTFLSLGKVQPGSGPAGNGNAKPFAAMMKALAPIYRQILEELRAQGVRTVQVDEPALVQDRTDAEIDTLIETYRAITRGLEGPDILVHTYYESLSAYERIVNELPVKGIGLDFTVNGDNLKKLVKHGFPKDKILLAGVVSGRDPWRTDFIRTLAVIREITGIVDEERVILSNAAPLFHLPVTVKAERGHLDERVLNMLSFADERLEELRFLKQVLNEGAPVPVNYSAALAEAFTKPDVRAKAAAARESSVGRPHPFSARYEKQRARFALPLFPSTTIGSFPQTKEVRAKRGELVKGAITQAHYDEFIREKIRELVALQEDIGLDILVHGEFERTDMVEFFGQKMDGFAFTANGWVQSYGTRCVRPPIIYGDISRPEAMTVKEVVYAQSLTKKPIKGMLTGPVTILNWSFCRRDIPREEAAYQIALALRDEVLDLEKAGIGIIQVDEPAFREGLPLKKEKQRDYLNWAIKAFKLTCDSVREDTQIHAHMCYSEFNEIIDSIYAMDADVISFEASRSRGELLEAFEKFKYDHGIGVGVYDVHSTRVPPVEEMRAVVERSIRLIDKKLFWINPDCGLKTRGMKETVAALRNMVEVSRALRGTLGG